MKMSKVFESTYLSAADVEEFGGEMALTIRKVTLDEIGKEKVTKPVLYFRQGRKALVLNQTNNNRLIAALGDESDDWIGKTITLVVEDVQFGADLVPAIRVRVDGKFQEERRPPTPQESAAVAQQPFDDLNDPLPF